MAYPPAEPATIENSPQSSNPVNPETVNPATDAFFSLQKIVLYLRQDKTPVRGKV